MKQPLISIISITYNNYEGLKNTLNSFSVGPEVEVIVIDGGSTDKTLSLKNNHPHGIMWISESDDGIYDAMNKGIKEAKGNYLIFMNAGDTFFEENSLALILQTLRIYSPDILYGETMLVDQNGLPLGLRSKITTRILPENLHWGSMRKGMLVCHQSFIVKRSIAPTYISNNLSADIDWQIKCLKKAELIQMYPKPISRFLIGGTSEKQKIRSLIDRFKVLSKHYGLVSSIKSHIYFVWRSFVFKPPQ